MSRYAWLECGDCKSAGKTESEYTAGQQNHAHKPLERLLEIGVTIAQFSDAIGSDWEVVFQLWGGQYNSVRLDWLAMHKGHDLYVCDEYEGKGYNRDSVR